MRWEQSGQHQDCSNHIMNTYNKKEVKRRLTSPYKNTLKTEFMCASWNNGSVDEVLKTYAAVIAAKGWGQYLSRKSHRFVCKYHFVTMNDSERE